MVEKFIEAELHPIIAGNFILQIRGFDLFNYLREDEFSKIVSSALSFFRGFFVDVDFMIPLNSVRTVNFDSSNFSLAPNLEDLRGFRSGSSDILKMASVKEATAWLRVKARSVADATERSSIILGALFLCMYHDTQYQHTMGKSADGILHFHKGTTYSSSSPHLPYLACPIELGAEDLGWLKSLDLALNAKSQKRKLLRALRWLHASWFATGAEQFSLICMAVDAIVPSRINSSLAKCGWIREDLGAEVDSDAVEMIFKRMRADVAHGDAPSLIESQAYLDFIGKYGEDPSPCALAVACRVIRNACLSDMRVQPHPLAKYPDYIMQQKTIMARHNLPFEVPTGFDFQRLRVLGAV